MFLKKSVSGISSASHTLGAGEVVLCSGWKRSRWKHAGLCVPLLCRPGEPAG